MFPYYCIFCLLWGLSFFDCLQLKKGQKYSLYFGLYFLLACFAGLRLTSPDYEAYKIYFELLDKSSFLNASEIAIVATDWGFVLINKLIGIFTDDSLLLFLFMSFVSVGINLSCYKKYTPYFFTAILFYFVHTFVAREMMQIRAGLACALCLYSVRFLVTKEIKRFLLTVLVAATIHLAALIFIVVYILVRIDFSKKTWILLLVISFAIGCISPLGQLLKMLPYMEGLERMQNYSDWEGYNKTLGVFSNPTVIKELVISSICLYYYDTLDRKVYAFKELLIIYLFSLCWLVVWNDFGIIAARIATFFSIGEVILLASLFNLFDYRSKYLYVLIVGASAFLILYLNILTHRFFEYHLCF